LAADASSIGFPASNCREFVERATRAVWGVDGGGMHLMREDPREDGLATPTAIVLVVDDEKRSLESLRRVLSIEFEVICAINAAEAEAVLAGDLVQA
jgi:PleD family two-component response regulator